MPDETVVVPAGHEVGTLELPFEPCVIRARSGAIVASLGSGGDDADRELEIVLAGVERELAAPPAMTRVVIDTGRIRMADLFAPAQPTTALMRTPVTWCFHAGGVASVMASTRRRRRFFERVAAIAPIMQTACAVDDPALAAFVEIACGLGVAVRVPDPSQGGNTAVIEVARPDGEILVVVAGLPAPQPAVSLDPAAALAKAGAPMAGDGARVVAYRSPRFLQIMLDIQAGRAAAARIPEELLAREPPVFAMRMPSGLELRNFNGERAIPVYTDAMAVQWAAADLGKPRDAYVAAAVDPRGLLAEAARGRIGVAVGLYRDRKTPMYALVPAAEVARVLTR